MEKLKDDHDELGKVVGTTDEFVRIIKKEPISSSRYEAIRFLARMPIAFRESVVAELGVRENMDFSEFSFQDLVNYFSQKRLENSAKIE